MQNTKEWIRID